ncbi:MAG: hypothetical protein ACT4PY_12135 [Armatimonadota bacterium]
MAWDIVTILEAWIRHVRELDWALLMTPTPARGRTLRELIVNVFHPIELLSHAWLTGTFAWHPDRDPERVERLVDNDAVVRYADTIHQGWTAFVLETGDRELASRDPVIESPRGALPYSALLSAQRWHAAFHYRQLIIFLTGEGLTLSEPLALDRFADLTLPAEVF